MTENQDFLRIQTMRQDGQFQFPNFYKNALINCTQFFFNYLENTDEIISLIYQYVNMLRKEGAQEWIFKECKVGH